MPIKIKPKILKYRDKNGEDQVVAALRGEPGDGLNIDDKIVEGSANPPQGGAVYDALHNIEAVRRGDNVFSAQNTTIGRYDDDGLFVTSGADVFRTTDYLAVTPGKYLFVNGVCPVGYAVSNRRINAFDADQNWIAQIGKYELPQNYIGEYSFVCDLPDDAAFVRMSYRRTDSDISIVEGFASYTSVGEMATTLENLSSGNGGGDIIQDPADENGGVVVSGTLAEIDKSLTLDNYAADAKVVGDKLSELENVKINGVETTDNNIPLASNNAYGVLKTGGTIYANRDIGGGVLASISRTAEQYKTDSVYMFVSKGTLNNVLATPSIMPALTAEEQQAAQQRLGIVPLNEEGY